MQRSYSKYGLPYIGPYSDPDPSNIIIGHYNVVKGKSFCFVQNFKMKPKYLYTSIFVVTAQNDYILQNTQTIVYLFGFCLA